MVEPPPPPPPAGAAAERPSVLVGAFATACPCEDDCRCEPDPAADEPGEAPATPTSSSGAERAGRELREALQEREKAAERDKAAGVAVSSPFSSSSGRQRVSKMTVYDASDAKGRDPADPTNTEEEFKRCGALPGLPPSFSYSVPVEKLQKRLRSDPMHEIRTEHTETAKAVLEAGLAARGGSAAAYESWVYGEEIAQEELQAYISDILCEHGLHEKVWVRFSPNKVSCTGAIKRSVNNTQEVGNTSRHVLWVSTAKKMRKHEKVMFVAHEIGTHLIRIINDEIQPWSGTAGKKQFGLHTRSSREFKETEEGLASINTAMHSGGGAKGCYLYREALLYYACARASELAFAPLFEELERYMPDPRRRFHFVTRIKRGLVDQSQAGGSGKVQVYFEGAVALLRRWDTLDLRLLYSGRLMLSEMERCKRLAHLQTITLPWFATNLEAYRGKLRHMAILNKLIDPKTAKRWPPPKERSYTVVGGVPLPRISTPSTLLPMNVRASLPSALGRSTPDTTRVSAGDRRRMRGELRSSLPVTGSGGGGLLLRPPSMREMREMRGVGGSGGALQHKLRERMRSAGSTCIGAQTAPVRMALPTKVITFPL